MRYKFNPYERAVGLFITVTISGTLFIGAGLAVKKHWFEKKVPYTTFVPTAANLREGSSVFMSGMKVGKIEKIELERVGNIRVTFSILEKFSNQITEGAQVQFVRPFILGDKALTLLQGPAGGKVLPAGEALPVYESLDLMEALSGKRLESVLAKVDSILNNLDQTMALSKNIAEQVADKKKLQKTLEDIKFASGEVRRVIPQLSANLPQASAHMARAMENLALISTELKDLQPEGSQKTLELLSESVITLKGIQKSFFLRGNVEEVRKEIEANRRPASK